MTKEEIQSTLIKVISKHIQLEPSSITPDQNLKYDLGLDSLDVAEMVYEIEEAFGITIPDDSAEKMEKISDTVEFIYSKIQTKNEELSTQ